jgi:hypothetical protein
MSGRVTTRTWVPVATAFLLVISAGVADSKPEQVTAPNREQMRKILARGHENRAKWRETKDEDARDVLNEQLKPILGEARLGLQIIPAGRGDQIRFFRAVLNSTGARFDAVRFRTPATGETFRLRWEFVVPGNDQTRNLQAWNIVGLDGPAPTTDEFSRRDNFVLPSSGFPEENYSVSTYVRGQPLRSDSEYILWFDLVNDQVTPAFIKVGLTPEEPAPIPRTAGVQKARAAYQSALKATNQRYDIEEKILRKAYLAELDKAARAATQRKDAPETDRIVAESDEILRGEAASTGRRGFRVLQAHYGIDERWIDVTDEVRPLIRGNVLRFGKDTDFHFKTDPAYGVLKQLVIIYSLDGNTGVSITADRQRVELPHTAPILDRIPPIGSYKP